MSVNVTMGMDAEYFERVPWRAELVLRQRIIEKRTREVRCSAKYDEDADPGDVLFIASVTLTKTEYRCYNYIFTELLKMSHDVWDVERNNGVSVDTTSSVEHTAWKRGRYANKPIIWAANAEKAVEALHWKDVFNHFLVKEKQVCFVL